MTLEPLSRDDAEVIRIERNLLVGCGILRTPYLLTKEMQEAWYDREIADRESSTRYWGIRTAAPLVGYGGLEFIDWVNGHAEMSLMVFANHRGKGIGSKAVGMFLDVAFNHLRLQTVYAECYECNPNLRFWKNQGASSACTMPRRKFHNGKLWDSIIFTWERQ